MPDRDYYVVLNVHPQATQEEIKIAYRKLALKYHPDRNAGNTHTEALFKEINEAYSVLSNQTRRDDYNRLRNAQQSSSYNSSSSYANRSSYSAASSGNYRQAYSQRQSSSRQRQEITTGKTILLYANHLRTKVERANPFAIDADSLYMSIDGVISEAHINILLYENKRVITSQVLHETLICCKPLPSNYFNALTPRLYRIAGNDAIMRNSVQQAVKQKKQDFFWQKYKFWWVLFVVLFICVLIYFV